ncbi:MAG TPA: hypothetical protein VGX23_32610 [Actinocrinis sp.]|nr:hypothetical protein [Actinocrinis sp.]
MAGALRRRLLTCSAAALITSAGTLFVALPSASATAVGITFSPDVISGGHSSTGTVTLAAVKRHFGAPPGAYRRERRPVSASLVPVAARGD